MFPAMAPPEVSPSRRHVFIPPLPSLKLTVPFAAAHYCSTGVHVMYTIRVEDTTNELAWQCARRYRRLREFHQRVGKYAPGGGAEFPSMLVTDRANRSKAEIEKRRQMLERYLSNVAAGLTGGALRQKPLTIFRVIKLLELLEYPYLPDWTPVLAAVADEDDAYKSNFSDTYSAKTPSETTDSSLDQAGAAALNSTSRQGSEALPQGEAIPATVSTRWRPPPVMPGQYLGLSLPFASLGMSVTGEWEASIRSERFAKRGLLRHRYDELSALAFHIAARPAIISLMELHDFIAEFRKRHPLLAYLRFELNLSTTTPKHASSYDRASSAMAVQADERNEDSIDAQLAPASTACSVPQHVALKAAHRDANAAEPRSDHHLMSAAPFMPERQMMEGGAPPCEAPDESPLYVASNRDLYPSATSAGGRTIQHYTLSEAAVRPTLHRYRALEDSYREKDERETAAANRSSRSSSVGSVDIPSYTTQLKKRPADGCRCNDKVFCCSTDGCGDVYVCRNGFTIVVNKPTAPS